MSALIRVTRFILSNLDRFRKRFAWTTVGAMLYGLLRFALPLYIAAFVDRIVRQDVSSIGPFLAGFIGLQLFRLIVAYLLRRHSEQLGLRFGNYIRNKLFRILLSRRSLWDVRFHSVHVLTLIGSIAQSSRQLIDRWIWSITSDFIFIPAVLIYVGLQNIWVAGFMSAAIIVFLIVGVYLTQSVASVFSRLNRNTAAFAARFGDFMANIRTVKKLHIEQFATGRTDSHEASLAIDIDDLKRLHARRWGILDSIFAVLYIVTIAWFLSEFIQGRTTAGTIVLLVYALDRLANLISNTVESVTFVVEMNAYLGNIEPFLQSEATELKTTPNAPDAWSAIQLKGVRFKHQESEDRFELAIDDLTIRRGERIGIAGKSGHGKSTLFDLLARHHRPWSGVISLDNQPFESLPKEFFARHLSFMTQDAELFSMTLRDNLLLGQEVPAERLDTVINGAGLRTLVDGLKDGLDTIVGERGVRLSTGERQRVSIGRGILLNRDIYLLDEITSNIDRDTEGRILEFLFKELKGKTVLFITHRIDNLRNMDRIILVDEGRIVAESTFTQLERTSELFRELLAHPELMTGTKIKA